MKQPKNHLGAYGYAASVLSWQQTKFISQPASTKFETVLVRRMVIESRNPATFELDWQAVARGPDVERPQALHYTARFF